MIANDIRREMRKAARERKFYQRALHPAPKSKRRLRKSGARKASTLSVDNAHLIEAIGALTAEIKALNATMAKPRPKRPPYGHLFAQYLEQKQ